MAVYNLSRVVEVDDSNPDARLSINFARKNCHSNLVSDTAYYQDMPFTLMAQELTASPTTDRLYPFWYFK